MINKKKAKFYILLSLGIISIIMFTLIYGPMTIFSREFNFFYFLESTIGTDKIWLFFVPGALPIIFLRSSKKLPNRERNWKTKGIFLAFIFSLFTEMFGAPLIIYLLSPFFPYPVLQRPLHNYKFLSTVISFIFAWIVLIGMSLVIIGWKECYDQKGLVKTGIYKHLRHPQYLGIILICSGWLLYWATTITLILAPILIYVYIKQAKREDAILEEEYGREFIEYRNITPAFIPW